MIYIMYLWISNKATNIKTTNYDNLIKLTDKTFTATNGRTFKVYSKETKKGLRFYKMNIIIILR